MRPLLVIVVLLLGLGLGGCEDAQALKAQETSQRLVGTWLREIEVDGAKGRRVLVLGSDGKFSETLGVEFADGRKGREERAGDWSYDGTNLKRRYTHEDGRQLSGNYYFVTFALTSFTGSEFEGRNYVQGEEVRYRKVAEGTKP
jgi:hypothetical protein